MQLIEIDTELPPEVKEITVGYDANKHPKLLEVIAWDDKLLLRPEDYKLVRVSE